MDFNIIQKDSVPVCPVDASGCFTAEVAEFAGQYVKVVFKKLEILFVMIFRGMCVCMCICLVYTMAPSASTITGNNSILNSAFTFMLVSFSKDMY